MSGIKHDKDKPMMHLTPALAELEEARVWTFGAKKYSEYNWTEGIAFSRIISALKRHLNAIQQGEDIDPESGCLHAAHIRCDAAMLIEFVQTGRIELDDRPLQLPLVLTNKAEAPILMSNSLQKEKK